MMEEFYKGFAQRARDLAEKADPVTRRRLLELAKRYDAKSRPFGNTRPVLPQRTEPPSTLFVGSGEA